MGYKHYNAVVDELEMFTNSNERFLYLECCYRADSKGRVLIPQITLAQITRLSLRTVARTFQALESKGFVEKLQHGQYRVTVLPQAETTMSKLQSKKAKVEALVEAEEELPELEEWEEYWEDNAKVDKNKIECLPIPNDEIPDFISEAHKEGKLKRRPNFEYDEERTCYLVYEKA